MGAFVFFLVYALGTVLFFPGSILTLGGGFAFSQAFGQGPGIAIASLAVFCGATLGACCAFLLGRYVMRESTQAMVQQYPMLIAIDRAVIKQGLKTVFLLRLSPLIPFAAFNYVMSTTGCSFKDYALGSFGMIPGTVAYVYFGSLLTAVTNAAGGSGGSQQDPKVYWSVIGVGVVATVAAVVLVSYFAKKEMNALLALVEAEKQVGDPEPSQDAGQHCAQSLGLTHSTSRVSGPTPTDHYGAEDADLHTQPLQDGTSQVQISMTAQEPGASIRAHGRYQTEENQL